MDDDPSREARSATLAELDQPLVVATGYRRACLDLDRRDLTVGSLQDDVNVFSVALNSGLIVTVV